MASVLDRAANNLARKSAKIARQGLVVAVALKAQRLVTVVAEVASGIGAEPLRQPFVVFGPCFAGIPQRLGFAPMALPDFQLGLLGLGRRHAAHGIQQLAPALPVLSSDGRAALRLLGAELGKLALVPLLLFTQLLREVCAMMLRGRDVVIPAGQVRPQRLGLALHSHDGSVSRLERTKPLGELRQAAPVPCRARLDGLIADVDVCSHATGLLVPHTTLGEALVQFCPARCRPDEFTSLFDGDARCALLARSAFHVTRASRDSGNAIQLANAGYGAIVHHRVACSSLRPPSLAVLNDGHRALCRLFPPALCGLHDLIGFRADLVDRDMQVDVVGVLMQRRNDLMFLELELFEKDIQQFLNLLGCGLLILMPRCNPMLDRVLGLLAFH